MFSCKVVEILFDSLHEVQTRKYFNESYKCKSQHYMEIEYDDNVLDYWRLPNGSYIVKLKKRRWIRYW